MNLNGINTMKTSSKRNRTAEPKDIEQIVKATKEKQIH